MALRPTTNRQIERTQSVAYTSEKDNAQDFNEDALVLLDHADQIEANATAIANKVDAVSGKGLSTEDYTTAEKAKVTNLPANTTSELATKADAATVTTALSNKADLVNNLVRADQLPSYVDDVIEYANLAAFPVTGVGNLIYLALDSNIQYRWSGSTYVALNSGIALGETSATAYRGDRGKTAYDHSQVAHDKTLVGLANVDNTSDANKPVSTAQQTALDLKANTSAIPTTLAQLSTDSANQRVSTAEKAAWNSPTGILVGASEDPSATLDFSTYDMATVTLTANLAITSVTNLTAISKRLFVLDGYTLSIYGVNYTNTRDGACSITFENWGEATPRVIDNYKVDAAPTEGFSDAPSDNKVYGRRNGGWVEIENVDTVPDAPTIATSINGLNIEIAITAGHNGGQAVTGWHIQDSDDGVTFADVEADTGNTTTPYVISSPASGDHYYRVASINSIGESAWSNVDSETISVITFDSTTVLGSIAGLNDRRAMKVTVPQNCTIQSISLYHSAHASGNLIVGVYSHNTGTPGSPNALLGSSASTAITNALGWQTISLASPVAVTSGQIIWLAFVADISINIRYANDGLHYRAEGDATFSLADPFGTNTVAASSFSIYANAIAS